MNFVGKVCECFRVSLPWRMLSVDVAVKALNVQAWSTQSVAECTFLQGARASAGVGMALLVSKAKFKVKGQCLSDAWMLTSSQS